jgi:hypothetical protein
MLDECIKVMLPSVEPKHEREEKGNLSFTDFNPHPTPAPAVAWPVS